MKKILTLMLALGIPGVVWGQALVSTNVTVNAVVPDNNQNGLATAFTLSGVSGAISSVTVSVDITGGFNGDLYAYLAGPNGGFAVLLNRSGVGSTSTYGYGNAGFNIMFSDAAANDVHNYQNFGPSYSGGQLQGTWQPDGGNINPQSSPASFPAGQTAMLSSFAGTDANGTWVFFIADLSPGGQSTLQNVVLSIMTVPEPSTTAFLALGLLALKLLPRRKR